MHVFLLISSLGAGGAERAMSELATFLAANAWDVTLATFDGADAVDFYPLATHVRRVRLARSGPTRSLFAKLAGNAGRVRALRSLIRREQPDVVLSFMETTNVLCLLATVGLRVPVVVAERIDPSMHLEVPRPWRTARRFLYRRAAAVVAQTEAAADWLRQHCGTRVDVIPNALRQLPSPTTPREHLVLAVGRMQPQKGFDLLLDAFAQIHTRYPGWRLAIVGDGGQRAALQARASRLGLSDHIEWPGRSNEVEAWYARASVVAVPSRYEGFPNVLLEAMAMGAAVVAADCRSGPREMVVPGENGLLVPVDDRAALAAALEQLVTDAALRERLGAAAAEVRSRFGAEKILPLWMALLTRVAKASPSRAAKMSVLNDI